MKLLALIVVATFLLKEISMSKSRLDDVLASKKTGELWWCVSAPEDVLIWEASRPWSKTFFEDCGVKPSKIRVTAHQKLRPSEEKFKIGEPLRLECGVWIRDGFIKTTQAKRAALTIPVDSTVEFNEAMSELVDKTGLTVWSVQKTIVYRNDVMITHTLHDPDSQGTGLFLFRAQHGKAVMMYPELNEDEQLALVGDYKEAIAKCCWQPNKQRVRSCGIKAAKERKARKSKLRTPWIKMN